MVVVFFFLMVRRPPGSTLFPTRRSSDLGARASAMAVATARMAARPNGLDTATPANTTAATPSSRAPTTSRMFWRSEEHTSELQSRLHLVCRLLLEKKNHIVNAADQVLIT